MDIYNHESSHHVIANMDEIEHKIDLYLKTTYEKPVATKIEESKFQMYRSYMKEKRAKSKR